MERGLLEKGLQYIALGCAPGLRVAADLHVLQVELHGRIKAITAHCPTRFAILHLITISIVGLSGHNSYGSTELPEQLIY